MRKTLLALSAVATVVLATPASAQPPVQTNAAVPVATGAAVGTVVGVGIYNGWFGSTVAGAALPTSVAGSAALGGIAGIGTIVLADAITNPCRGFHALFRAPGCVNGEYVGEQAAYRYR